MKEKRKLVLLLVEAEGSFLAVFQPNSSDRIFNFQKLCFSFNNNVVYLKSPQ